MKKCITIFTQKKDILFEFLKEYANIGTTFYLYIYDENQYIQFSNIHKTFLFKRLKLIVCSKMVNTIREKNQQHMIIKKQHEEKCNH